MKLTFIWHDCFLLETDVCDLIFDYWKVPGENHDDLRTIPEFLLHTNRNKPLYVIVSHHHKDHFNKKIFGWSDSIDNIRYVISKDTARSINYMLRENSTYSGRYRIDKSKLTIMKPLDVYCDDFLQINAFGSTDIGNSYLIKVGNKYIFHAGDLNAWVWKDESTQHEIALAINDFKSKLIPIHNVTDKIDLAMFPVDSRIGRDYWEGAAIFVNNFFVDNFVPMHFCLGENEQQQKEFEESAFCFENYANKNNGKYIALNTIHDTIQF